MATAGTRGPGTISGTMGWRQVCSGREVGSPSMPLVRASDDRDPENLVGVPFPMVEALRRGRPLTCQFRR
jgi:hypothetical protein